MSRGVLLLVALAFASSVAAADAWVSFRNKEHRVIEVSNIQLENGVRKYWTKDYPPAKTVRGPGIGATKWVFYYLSLNAINCETHVYRLSSKEIYFEDGTTLSLPTESSWAAVTDTDFQGEMKLICDTELQ
jgi:hypothetical protein